MDTALVTLVLVLLALVVLDLAALRFGVDSRDHDPRSSARQWW
ncbi:MAG: hypothetical protein AVDCRST_MAG49-3929 [uncultured Thermomicrobiales bacterium]|uniref:Uncharacterized protein n=1 Tax=uncultured Thermomicrobiales bacterium TaxID=1645740 RepID=A0A6J4VF65_9BACT|nr:MAG: hypothetical protein AVDCRST_MAG49-3929 [uncultured Thermomicrobiales bacterium]